MLLFAFFAIGVLVLVITSPLLFINIGTSKHIIGVIFWVAAITLVITSFKVSKKLMRRPDIKTQVNSDLLVVESPWLINDGAAVQYKRLQFDPQKGVSFIQDLNGHTKAFSFDEINSIRHSYNLRLPVLYLTTKDNIKYTIAFVINATDVQSIKKSTAKVFAFGEVGGLTGSSTAVRSSYRQINLTGDSVEIIYQWFRKHRRGVYKNKLSRNVLMLIIFLAFFPTIMTIGILIETVFE